MSCVQGAHGPGWMLLPKLSCQANPGRGGGGGIHGGRSHHSNIISPIKKRSEGLEESSRHLMVSIQDADYLIGWNPLAGQDVLGIDLHISSENTFGCDCLQQPMTSCNMIIESCATCWDVYGSGDRNTAGTVS